MVKKAPVRKNNRSKPGRRTTRRRNISGYPPPIPFDKCFMDVTLRQSLENSSMAINTRLDKTLTIASLFDGPWISLRSTFSQVKVKKIHIYAIPAVGLDECGWHAINVAPPSEFVISEKTSFSLLTSLPGTKIGRISRLLTSVWYPTSPDEREWVETDSTKNLIDYCYMSNGMQSHGKATATYPIEFIVDAHVRLRGVHKTRLGRHRSDMTMGDANDDELDAEFVNLAT